MAGLYDNTGFVPSWARARMAAEGVQPYDGEPGAQPLPPSGRHLGLRAWG